jgi:hypothetical protein
MRAAKKKPAISLDDPVLRALRQAPVGEPETEEERHAVAEARSSTRSGWVAAEKVSAEIAERRRRDG